MRAERALRKRTVEGLPVFALAETPEILSPDDAFDRDILKDRDGNVLPLIEPAFITTADIASVAVGSDGTTGHGTLILRFTDAAAPRILAATEARVAKRVAFTVGDQVLNVAVIAGPFAQSMQVSGLDSTGEAHRLYTEITGKAP
jgi:preprotein translocase subunit SecD